MRRKTAFVSTTSCLLFKITFTGGPHDGAEEVIDELPLYLFRQYTEGGMKHWQGYRLSDSKGLGPTYVYKPLKHTAGATAHVHAHYRVPLRDYRNAESASVGLSNVGEPPPWIPRAKD